MRSARKMKYMVPFAVAATVMVAGCSEDSAGPEQDASVEDVAEAEPDANDQSGDDLLGQDVTVSGEITESVADGSFLIGGGGDIFSEGAPVVSATGTFADMGIEDAEGLIDSDTIVQVSGTVQEFVLLDLEEEWGIDLVDSDYEDLEGEAVIVADQVDQLAGEEVTTSGTVSELLSTVAFRLEGANWSVVVLDSEQATVAPGDMAEVTGTVRQMNITEIEEDYGLDLDDELYADYEGDLVLVADQVSSGDAAATTE